MLMRALSRPRGAGRQFRTVVAEGDSVMRGGGLPNGISPAVYWSNPESTTNEAVGGSTIASLNTRLATSLTNNPDADYIIHCGGNDALQGDTLEAMQTRTQTALTTLENANRQVIWCAIPPVSNSPSFTAGEWTVAKNWNAWAETEVTTRGHIWVNQWPYIEDPDNPEETLPAYLFGGADVSNIHLSEAGAQEAAKAFDVAVAQARLRWPA